MTEASDDALETFVRARGRQLYRSAWLLTGDPHRAEDLVQTALAKTWHKLPDLGPEAFEAYLRTTLYHTYLSWWRRRWTGEVPSETLERAAVDGDDPAQRWDVARALAALPRAQRAVVVLCYVEDLTRAQAAEVLGISVGTVKSNLSRALANLRTSPLLNGGNDD